MSELEPRDVGPRVGGDLPAGPQDKALARQVLDAAAREGRLPLAEYQRRAAIADQAQTFDDLIPLTRDLVPAGTPNPVQAVQPYGGPQALVPAPGSGEVTVVGLFGGFERKGQWTAPGQVKSITVFGGGELDLRDAVWTSPVLEVTITAMFGGLEIKIPPGTEVTSEVVSIFGGVGVKGSAGPGAARRLVLKGFCCFGGVGVKTK